MGRGLRLWAVALVSSVAMALGGAACVPGVALAHSVAVDVGAGAPAGTVGISARFQPMKKGFLELSGGRGLTGTQVGFGLASVLRSQRLLGATTQLYAIGSFSLGFHDQKVGSWTPRSVKEAGTYHWVNLGAGVEWFKRGSVSIGSEAGLLMSLAVVPSEVSRDLAPRHVSAYARALRLGFAF